MRYPAVIDVSALQTKQMAFIRVECYGCTAVATPGIVKLDGVAAMTTLRLRVRHHGNHNTSSQHNRYGVKVLPALLSTAISPVYTSGRCSASALDRKSVV